MEHLKNNEIMDFVRIAEFSADSRKLLKKVNRHIISCPECAEKVKRAARGASIMEAISKDGFSAKDLGFSEYDVPAEAVALEAASAFEDDNAYRY